MKSRQNYQQSLVLSRITIKIALTIRLNERLSSWYIFLKIKVLTHVRLMNQKFFSSYAIEVYTTHFLCKRNKEIKVSYSLVPVVIQS